MFGQDSVPDALAENPPTPDGATLPYATAEVPLALAVIEKTCVGLNPDPMVKLNVWEI